MACLWSWFISGVILSVAKDPRISPEEPRLLGENCYIYIDARKPRFYPEPMTVTAQYAAEHFPELAAAAARGSDVSITAEGGVVLDLRARLAAPEIDPAFLDKNGQRKLGSGADLVGPDCWERWAEIERDWDENVIPNLWMNRDDEQEA